MKKLFTKLIIVSLVALVGLAMLSYFAPKPEGLGVVDGQLAECPDKPNCVSTQTSSSENRMQPISFTGTPEEKIKQIKSTVSENCVREKLVEEQSPTYLRYEFRSLVFRFVDDVEFYIDDAEKLIHFRSAARVGHSDLGVNRARMEKLTAALQSSVGR